MQSTQKRCQLKVSNEVQGKILETIWFQVFEKKLKSLFNGFENVENFIS